MSTQPDSYFDADLIFVLSDDEDSCHEVDDEITIISHVQRPRRRTRSQRSDLKTADESTIVRSGLSSHLSTKASVDDTVQLIKETRGIDPFINLPHFYNQCRTPKENRNLLNYCTNCYCRYCNCPASQCTTWSQHSLAHFSPVTRRRCTCGSCHIWSRRISATGGLSLEYRPPADYCLESSADLVLVASGITCLVKCRVDILPNRVEVLNHSQMYFFQCSLPLSPIISSIS